MLMLDVGSIEQHRLFNIGQAGMVDSEALAWSVDDERNGILQVCRIVVRVTKAWHRELAS